MCDESVGVRAPRGCRHAGAVRACVFGARGGVDRVWLCVFVLGVF